MNELQKKSIRWFVVSIFVAAIIGLPITGCDKDNGDDNDNNGPASAPAQNYTGESAVTWMDLSRRLVKSAVQNPPWAARTYGYCGVTLYEATLGGMPNNVSMAGQLTDMPAMPVADANLEYHWPSVVNAAVSGILNHLFTYANDSIRVLISDQFDAMHTEFAEVVAADVLERSETYGESVATAVGVWADGDGFAENHNCSFTVPTGPQYWVPTPPGFASPIEPCWGSMRFFVPGNVEDICMPDAPPPYSEVPTSQFYTEMMEVYNTVNAAVPEEREIAAFWADPPGTTATPAGHWIAIVSQIVEQEDMTLDMAVETYCRTGVAMADAFISCWYSKYVYNYIRPVTVIQRLVQADWLPPWATPPFPECTSGHSCQSGAASQVLEDFLGDIAFSDHYPNDNLGYPVRSFDNFFDASREAADSRLYGGIHFSTAIEAGLLQGKCIGMRVSALTFRAGS